MTFDQWDVVLARFPFVEKAGQKLRPVVVLSTAEYNDAHGFIISVMITSASEGRLPSDHEIIDLQSGGLKHPCFVRWKIATLAEDLFDRRIGALAEDDRLSLQRQIADILPLKVPE